MHSFMCLIRTGKFVLKIFISVQTFDSFPSVRDSSHMHVHGSIACESPVSPHFQLFIHMIGNEWCVQFLHGFVALLGQCKTCM